MRRAYTATGMSGAPIQKKEIWLIADGQPGNETQIRGLAALLADAGAGVSVKQVRSNRWHMLGAALLGASGRSIDSQRSDSLEAPWPDLVIATGRRSAPWARYVKAESGGRAKIAMFGQKGANLMRDVDLAVVLAHWRFPAHPRRETILTPPTAALASRIAAAVETRPGLLPQQEGPWTLLVVGGTCFDHTLTAEAAGDIARRAEKAATALGGRLAIVSSRRTGAAAEAAMAESAPTAKMFPWTEGEGPFLALLGQADAAIVTGDSESMAAEAASAGLPTYIAPVKRRWTVRTALERSIAAAARLGGPFRRLVGGLWAAAVLLPPRDLEQMIDGMEAAERSRRFIGERIDIDWRPTPPDDPALAARLLEL